METTQCLEEAAIGSQMFLNDAKCIIITVKHSKTRSAYRGGQIKQGLTETNATYLCWF